MTAKSNRPAYSYLRLSSAQQIAGDGQRRQSSDAERASREHGWRLSDVTFKDLGVSGFRGRNRTKGALSTFLDMLESGKLEKGAVLILEDFDRLSRDRIMASFDLVRRILEGGCDVFCTLNWRLYTSASLNEPMSIMEMLWRFYLSHEESVKKSVRSRANWKAKHARAGEEILTHNCPGWLRVEGGRFVEIKEHVATVRKIFRWSVEGMGALQIAKKLNAEDSPSWQKTWAQKTIWRILTDGRVLGHLPVREYGEKNTPVEPIKNYYPAVIDQGTYYASLNAIQGRKGRTGRRGNFVNIFSGLCYHPGTDSTLVFVSKPRGGKKYHYSYLASYKGLTGLADYFAVPYAAFERAVLLWLTELDVQEVTGDGERDHRLEELEGRKAFLTSRIGELAATLSAVGVSVPAVVTALAEMESQKSAVIREIEEVKRSKAGPAAGDVIELVEMLAGKSGDELAELRGKIRQQLLALVKRIDVAADEKTDSDGKPVRWKSWTATVHFHSGEQRQIWFTAGP